MFDQRVGRHGVTVYFLREQMHFSGQKIRSKVALVAVLITKPFVHVFWTAAFYKSAVRSSGLVPQSGMFV